MYDDLLHRFNINSIVVVVVDVVVIFISNKNSKHTHKHIKASEPNVVEAII